MRGLFTLIGFLVVAALIVGHFRGWYTITKTPSANGHQGYSIDVNTQKAKEDISKGTKAAVNAVTPAKTSTAQNPAPPANPPQPTWGPSPQ